MTIQAKRPSQAGRPVDIFFRGGFDFNLILGWHSEKQTNDVSFKETLNIKTFYNFRSSERNGSLLLFPSRDGNV